MQFNLTTNQDYYHNAERVEALQTLGFVFTRLRRGLVFPGQAPFVWRKEFVYPTRDITTLEELIDFIRRSGLAAEIDLSLSQPTLTILEPGAP